MRCKSISKNESFLAAGGQPRNKTPRKDEMQKEGSARRETQLDADCRFPDAKLKQKVEPSNFLPFCGQSSRLCPGSGMWFRWPQ